MKRLFITTIAAAICCSSMAQKPRKMKNAAKTQAKVEVIEEDPRLEEMRQSTQKIMFIDSIVVDKSDILNALNKTKDAGTVAYLAAVFKSGGADDFVFVNEMGNKCYYSKQDGTQKELFSCDFIGNKWTNAQKVTGLCDGTELTNKNYPFMMSDGITLYFAAEGDESIGGWDIFVTRYDSDDNTYLKAENIGMPFNSPANDYFYIVDDINNIGWFASDRRQPEGKVCVYTFIPSETRQNYNTDNMSEETLLSLSSLLSIKDTWGKGNERQEALQRLNTATAQKVSKDDFLFVINDNTVYTKLSDFRHKENVEIMKEITAARDKLSKMEENLEKSRAFYIKASNSDKEIMSSEIMDMEQQVEELQIFIASKEKKIRNSENK
mgnify:CR=1 FL=1